MILKRNTINKLAILIFSSFFSYIFITKIGNTPDFQGYAKYTLFSDALNRFSNEPVSAILIGLSGYLGYLELYYYFGVLIFMHAIWCVMKKNNYFSIVFFINTIANPFSLVMFYVPRNSIAVAICLYILSTNIKPRKIIIYVLTFFTHNLAFVANIVSIFYLRASFIGHIFLAFVIMSFVFLALSGIIQGTRFDLSFYITENAERRGVARGVYFLIFAVLSIFVQYIYNNKKCDMSILWLSILSLLLIYINPFTNRLVISFFTFYFVYRYSSSRIDYQIINLMLFPFSIFLLIFVIFLGNYGYS
jgi:hypothetical protein